MALAGVELWVTSPVSEISALEVTLYAQGREHAGLSEAARSTAGFGCVRRRTPRDECAEEREDDAREEVEDEAEDAHRQERLPLEVGEQDAQQHHVQKRPCEMSPPPSKVGPDEGSVCVTPSWMAFLTAS